MSALIEHLESFNRKERFHLLREALGEKTFKLDRKFRTRLGRKIGVKIPGDAFVAMDYHLDWLQMALYLAENPSPQSPIPNPDDALFRANQEDVDLLVAFDEGAKPHLVLVEAKMETSWTNKQLGSKVKRLRHIFGEDRPGADLVEWHFVLASPKESRNIDTDCWPPQMTRDGKPVWMELPRPPRLVKVTRGTAGSGTVVLKRVS